MNVQFNTIQDKLKYALRDYTSIGRQSPFSFSFLTDEQVYQIHPERYAFYLQMLDALQDPNSGILDRVLSIENKSRYARDQLQRTSADVAKALRYLSLNMANKKTGGADNGNGNGNEHKHDQYHAGGVLGFGSKTAEEKIKEQNKKNFIDFVTTICKKANDRYENSLSSYKSDLIDTLTKIPTREYKTTKIQITDYVLKEDVFITDKGRIEYFETVNNILPLTLDTPLKRRLYDILYRYYAFDYIIENLEGLNTDSNLKEKRLNHAIFKYTYETRYPNTLLEDWAQFVPGSDIVEFTFDDIKKEYDIIPTNKNPFGNKNVISNLFNYVYGNSTIPVDNNKIALFLTWINPKQRNAFLTQLKKTASEVKANAKKAKKKEKYQQANEDKFLQLINNTYDFVKQRYGDIIDINSKENLIKYIKDELEFTNVENKAKFDSSRFNVKEFHTIVRELAPSELLKTTTNINIINHRKVLYDILYYYYALDYIFDEYASTRVSGNEVFDKVLYKYVHKKVYANMDWGALIDTTDTDKFITHFKTDATTYPLFQVYPIDKPKILIYKEEELQSYISSKKDRQTIKQLIGECEDKLESASTATDPTKAANEILDKPEYVYPCLLAIKFFSKDMTKLIQIANSKIPAPPTSSTPTTLSTPSSTPSAYASLSGMTPAAPAAALGAPAVAAAPAAALGAPAVAAPGVAPGVAAPGVAAAAGNKVGSFTIDEPTKQLLSKLNVLIESSSSPVKFITEQKGGSYYTDLLDKVELIQKDQKDGKGDDAQSKLAAISDEVNNHPVFNPENEKISMTDRVVFIAVTFMIRGLALFLIDWGVNSQLITTFNRAFLYYTLIYFTLFMMWVLLVNAGSESENIPLKMAFYYVNWGANGIARILVHIVVQTFLIPIPFIVREPLRGAPDTATYEKRRAVYRVLSNFTFFIWVMTSIIALRF